MIQISCGVSSSSSKDQSAFVFTHDDTLERAVLEDGKNGDG
jgi:hypothetical protein